MEMALRYAQELQEKKKRQVAVYERLEKELTQFELEEDQADQRLSSLIQAQESQ